MNEDDRITDLAERISRGVRRRRLERSGYTETEIAREPAPLPDTDLQTWRDVAESVVELFGVKGGPVDLLVQDEHDVEAALEAVMAWATQKPELIAESRANTDAIVHRGRVLVSRDDDGRIGVSTYETRYDAMNKAVQMEKGMRAYLEAVGEKPKTPKSNPRAVEEKLGIHPEFGGLVGLWIDEHHAAMLRVGHGKIVEVLQLTPLNALQAARNLEELIRRGKAEGYITEQHERESAELPPMPASEYHPDYAPKD